MVRVCAVEGCLSSDLTHLSHRFPKDVARAKEWQDALELSDKDIEMLMDKYTVCTKHFEKKDYRNIESRHLNKTALPKLVTSFWNPPEKDKTFAIAIEMDNELDRNSLHVNIIDHKSLDIETIDQEETVVEEIEELDEGNDPQTIYTYETITQRKGNDVVRKIKSKDRGEYFIVVEEEDTSEDPKGQKRKIVEASAPKNKKYFPTIEVAEETEEMLEEEVQSYDLEEKIYQDGCTQTEEDEEEIEDEVLNSGYWECSKADLIRMLMEKDDKCSELEKKVDDFKQAKEKMLQSIEMLKMM
ncbi:uncharacterized protein LOC129809838 [Phlebotomus papatasi]|uniref:uncharacterized protein LOC129809838 n=1 Tax=Phlebotomus papatasi TaxID=29031 RepID=UPI002483E68E|nr:uncharacterized protein LOC129809838 [Phlebotomus papatasi]